MSTRRERAGTQSAKDKKRHTRSAGLPPCPSQALALKRACGHQQAVLIKCHSPLCPECERDRAARLHDRWINTLAWLPNLKMLTLTIENGHNLKERITTLYEARRRLLDLRLGRNNRNNIRRAVQADTAQKVKAGTLTQDKADQRLEQVERWLEAVARTEAQHGKSPKMRTLMKGLAFLENTYNAESNTWHAHLHCIVSMRYMPQSVLKVVWRMATRGAGKVVDIRKTNDAGDALREVAKYVSKAWEIPQDEYKTVIDALAGVKRISRIGNIKPMEVEKPVCPGCNKPSCDCGTSFVARADSSQAIIPGVVYKTTVYDMGMSYEGLLTVTKDIHGHRVWSVGTLASNEVLSTYLHSVSSKGDLPPPTHSPPRTFTSDEVVISIGEVKK